MTRARAHGRVLHFKNPELAHLLPDGLREAFQQKLGRGPIWFIAEIEAGKSRLNEAWATGAWASFAPDCQARDGANDAGEAAGPSAPKARRFRLVPFAELRPGPEPLYLVDELIPVAGLVDVWGKAKCFKSFWTLDLMLHVAMGWEYRDRYVRQGAVVYCAFEGAHGYKKRIEALRRHYDIAEDAVVPLYVMPGQANLIAEHRVLISDIAEQLGGAMPVRRGARHPEQEPGRVREQGRRHGRLCPRGRGYPRPLRLCRHHRPSLRLRRHPASRAFVTARCRRRAARRSQAGGVITVTVEMMRDGPEDTQVVSGVEVIEVGEDQNGKTLTSLVVVPSDADAADGHSGWPRGLRVFYGALKAALAGNGVNFQPEAGTFPFVP